MSEAQQGDTDLCHEPQKKLLSTIFAEHLSGPKNRILDAGCGAARFLKFFREHYRFVDLFDHSYAAMKATKDLIRTSSLQ